MAVFGWMDLETGLLTMPELLWNVEGVVLVHGVTYRNSWLFAAVREDCVSENGSRLVGGVKPVWCKWIGQKAERGDPDGGFGHTVKFVMMHWSARSRTGWKTYTNPSAHVNNLTIRGWQSLVRAARQSLWLWAWKVGASTCHGRSQTGYLCCPVSLRESSTPGSQPLTHRMS